MPPPVRAHFPTGIPGLEWLLTDDGSRTLFNTQLDEAYHSGCGAAAESLQVYLINSGVAARLQSKQPTRVLEVGFGTGMAFFLTAALAEACQVPLHYTALEFELLPTEIFEEFAIGSLLSHHAVGLDGSQSESANGELPMATISRHWLDARRNLDMSLRLHRIQIGEFVQLDLVLEDVRKFTPINDDQYHAIFFDPFSPETSPELWTGALFEKMFAVLHPLGTLTSYCVKGTIRRELTSVGFEVSKTPGPIGGKREVLKAVRPASVATQLSKILG